MTKTLLPLLAAVLCGCARFSTNQTQNDVIGPDGTTLTRTTSTKVAATTFFEAKSVLTQFKATQTDKTQGATVGSLGQDASSTNLNAILEAVVGAAVKAAIPVPKP